MNSEFKTTVKQDLTKNIVTGKGKFSEIVGTSAFVDKTLFIQEIVNSGDAAILITCPRRFGKSSNLNMLKTFLEIEVDDEGKAVEDKSQTKNYKLFEKLDIAQDKTLIHERFGKLFTHQHYGQQFMQNHCGQHPVIFVDFLNVKGDSYEEVLDKVKLNISSTFQQHKYMIDILDEISNNTNLKRSERKNAKNFLDKFERLCDNDGQNATNLDIQDSLRFLSEVLYSHFKKRVYVLVDEYDAPVRSAIQEGLDDATVKKVNGLIDGILCAVMKSNDQYLERGVMTGISGMVRISAGSGLNNVMEFKFLDKHEYHPYYGFTEKEVDIILENLDLQHMKEGIENWYNGYRIRSQEKKSHIFCPWSVLQYLKKGELGNYWEASGSIQNIQAIFKNQSIRETMEALIRGEELEFTIDTKLNLDKVKHLMSILNCAGSLPQVDTNLFFSYLFELGYLSNIEGKPGYYKLPNEEIRSESAQRILDYYIREGILSEKDVSKAIKTMEQLLNHHDSEDDSLEKDIQGFKEALSNLFKPIPLADMRDPKTHGVHPNESLLQVIIGSLAIKLVADNLLKSPTDAHTATPPKGQKIGAGTEVPVPYLHYPPRSDIVLVKGNVGVIIELKFKVSAKEALKQIEDKDYKSIFDKYTYIPKIKQIGVAVNFAKNKKDKVVDIKYNLTENAAYQESSSDRSSTTRSSESSNSTESNDPSTSVKEVRNVGQHKQTRSGRQY